MRLLKILLTIAMATSTMFAMADTLPSTKDALLLTDKAMAKISKGDISGGAKEIRKYFPISDAEFESIVEQVNLQLPVINKRFGKNIGHERLNDYAVGDSLYVVNQLQKQENAPLRWNFIFYKNEKGWVLNTVYFDGDINSLTKQLSSK